MTSRGRGKLGSCNSRLVRPSVSVEPPSTFGTWFAIFNVPSLLAFNVAARTAAVFGGGSGVAGQKMVLRG